MKVVVALVVLTLFATGCRVDVSDTAMQSGSTVAAPTVAPDDAEPADASATVSPDPPATVEPTPTSTPEPSPDTATASGEASAVPDAWSDIEAPDPALIDGVLDNGLRYLIQPNAAPGGQAQLRLVVEAGAVQEQGPRGVAHFLEHMMFNGTERFPGNDIVDVLEGFGGAFGPDINAYTSYEETVYFLTVPTRAGNDTLQLALEVLVEWAANATLDIDEVIAERGVVREELRLSKESVQNRIWESVQDGILGDTVYLTADPIGNAPAVENMAPDHLRDFYERWYRPDLMTVIAVGDFVPSQVESLIVDTFGAIPAGEGAPLAGFAPDRGSGPLPEPVFDVIVDSEILQNDIEIYWRNDRSVQQSMVDVRSVMLRRVALEMVSQRLFEHVQRGGGALFDADAGSGPLTPNFGYTNLFGSVDPRAAVDGVAEIVVELERIRQHGFSEEELARVRDRFQTSFDQDFAERGTIQDGSIAGGLVDYALVGAVPLSPERLFETQSQLLDSITAADAQMMVTELLEGNPYVLLTGPAANEATLPSPEELAEAYYSVLGASVEPLEGANDAIDQLMEPPEPASIVNTEQLDAIDVTVVTYANGARLAMRNTTITENLVEFSAVSPGGFFAVDGPEVPLLNTISPLIIASGFASIDPVTLDRYLSGSLATLDASISRSSEAMYGSASTGDIETLMQLVHLQMVEPSINDVQLRTFNSIWRPLVDNPSSDPGVASDLELFRLRYGNSPWYRLIPTPEDLDALDPELMLDAWQGRFDNAADFVFMFVGDFDQAEVVELGARYIGTLPSTGATETPVKRDPGIPEENLVGTVRAGVGDQGQVTFNWEAPYPVNLESEILAAALEIIVNSRLRIRIREELGGSYGPRASVTVLREPVEWIDSTIQVAADPDRLEELSAAVRAELVAIQAGEIDQETLDIAIEQLSEQYRYFTNGDWLSFISRYVFYPERSPEELWDRTEIAQSITIADVAEAARVAFPPSRSVEVRLVPAG